MNVLEFSAKLASLYPQKKRGLVYKFGWFIALATIVPTITIASTLILIERRTLKQTLYQQQLQTAQRVADRVWLHMQHIHSVMAIAALEPGLASFPRSRQEESLRLLLRWQPDFKEAFLLNPQGKEIAKMVVKGKRIEPSNQYVSRKNRPEFVKAIHEKRTVIGAPFFSADQLPYAFASCPSYGRRATLVARVSLQNLWQLLRQVSSDQPAKVYLADGKGNLLAHPDFKLVQSHAKIQNEMILKSFEQGERKKDSYKIYKSKSGEKVVGLIYPVPESDWVVVLEIPTKVAYASLYSMQKEVLKWSVFCTMIVLLIGFWKIRQILKPIKTLQRAAQNIAKGNMNFNLKISTGDELEQLANAFNQMTESLKEMETLRHDLISMLVHDLKNPLSSIMGGLDYFSIQLLDKATESQKKVLNITKKSADDLSNMIQNLLDVAKMEDGKLELQVTSVSVENMLKECVDSFRVNAKREAKVLTVHTESNVETFPLDEQLMRRVMHNLIANAVRHTPAGGRIHVYAEFLDGHLHIVVEDNGEGIPKEYQEKIFSKFVQAQRKRAHLRTGTGLGLTFCKMVVELHRGKIMVQSEMGKGSAFIVNLPIPKSLV